MEYRVISLKVSGIKNIEKELEISFIKKNFNEDIFDDSYIKAIYGPNGSGKTGIANAFELYRNVVLNEFPFFSDAYNGFISNLINKRTRRFMFDLVLAVKMKDVIHRINHLIEISKGDNGKCYISHEAFYILNSRLEKQKLIYEAKEGNIDTIKINDYSFSSDEVVVRNNSVVSAFTRSFFGDGKPKRSFGKASNEEKAIAGAFNFASDLFVAYGDKQDKHTTHFYNWVVNNPSNRDEYPFEYINNQLRESIKLLPGSNCFDVIDNDEKSLANYKKYIKRMEKFVKRLKQDLIKIEVKEKNDGRFYFINLDFVYKDYTVDYEYESTGVKKICQLFSAFSAAKNGHITIIDEIDSNIHDTYLVKLMEYFALYSNAQIICTTHNVEIMSVIKSRSKSIDFLSDDNRVVPWIQTGKLSPSTLYLKGRIKYIPFNLDSSEFGEVFSDE